jgi:hypothetical protein
MIPSTMIYRRFRTLRPYLLFWAHIELAIAEAASIVLAQQKILILGTNPAGKMDIIPHFAYFLYVIMYRYMMNRIHIQGFVSDIYTMHISISNSE